MFPIEVTGINRVVNYTSKGGAAATFTVQEAYAHIPGQKYPSRIELLPPKGQLPYAAGAYSFDASSVYVDQNNKLALGLKLIPAKR